MVIAWNIGILYTVNDTNISCKEGKALYEKILCIGHEYFASKFKSEMCIDYIYGKRIGTKCTGNGSNQLKNQS